MGLLFQVKNILYGNRVLFLGLIVVKRALLEKPRFLVVMREKIPEFIE